MSNEMYLSGFGNEFATEAESNTLPVGQNNPQRVAHGLVAEQLSGTAFTAPIHENRRSWLYRIAPAVIQGAFEPYTGAKQWKSVEEGPADPSPMRWDVLPMPTTPTDFVDGFFTFATNGSVAGQSGCGVHMYACNASMTERFFYDADGDLLMVPQEGELLLRTELGNLGVEPGEIALIPRGMKFQVQLQGKQARGYVCENFGALFRIPDRGPIGANGLANARDFLCPTASYEDRSGDFELVARFQGGFWRAPLKHSPLDVVAWHGNYVPYKYALRDFNTIGSISFDHPDPSIFTVLTSPSATPGVANVDFVIFPERWMVAEHTFRPPYYHRNVMSEFMGLIYGVYDAKPGGFAPGAASLHNSMTGHGPSQEAFAKASDEELGPVKYTQTLAFMFESRYVFRPTDQALKAPFRQSHYQDCWQGLPRDFSPPK